MLGLVVTTSMSLPKAYRWFVAGFLFLERKETGGRLMSKVDISLAKSKQ
jgi:hypothetical protein